jgi:SpoU rRNA methylase family enzyme
MSSAGISSSFEIKLLSNSEVSSKAAQQGLQQQTSKHTKHRQFQGFLSRDLVEVGRT